MELLGCYRSGDDGVDHDSSDNADDNDLPNTVVMEHLDYPPLFMRVLDLQTMRAPEFPEYKHG